MNEPETPSDDTIRLLDHGFVRLDDAMADDLSVVNGARVSFARRKTMMAEADEGLIRFLMRDRHGSPFEHNAFRFHIRCPIFVAREWFRHRIGCLTGDTVVTFVDTNGHAHMRKTVDELVHMWEVGERVGHALTPAQRAKVRELSNTGRSRRSIARELGVGRRSVRTCLSGANGMCDGRARLRRMRVRVLDESTREFTFGHISDVIDKGVQPVYRLTLADGKHLTLTENHRILSSDGWLTMRAAVGLVGDGFGARMTRVCHVMVNGLPVHQDAGWLAERRRAGLSVREIAAEAGCSYHTVRKWLKRHGLSFAPHERHHVPWNRGESGYSIGLRHTPEHLRAIRAARPKRGRETGNLISLSSECHRGVHRSRETELAFMGAHSDRIGGTEDVELPTRRGFTLTSHPVRVVAVAYEGLRQTYDLSIEGPWHNFVANGMVVHNSFNEFSMRYAKATDDFYVPAAEDVRTQVGKPGAYRFEPVDAELAEEAREELEAVYQEAYAAYARLVERGVARELARSVIPVGAYTQFYWTVNARALMNFVSLRNAEFAQLEIRRYAEAVEDFFARKMPVTHAAFVANDRTAP